METEKEITAKIISVTMRIRECYPELYENLGEMPLTIPNESNPEIDLKSLQDYYESLKTILRKYIAEHDYDQKHSV